MEAAIHRPLPSMIQLIKPVMRGVLLEAMRRKEFYSVFLIAAIFAIGAIVVRIVGIENASTGTFILNLGLTYAYYAAHLVAALLVIKQVPSEIENRTLYPILAKPVSRATYLLGKWSAAVFTGIVIYLILTIFVWITSPKMEDYNSILLLQNIILNFFSIGALCGMCLFLSIICPVPVGIIISGIIFMFSDNLLTIASSQIENESTSNIINWLLGYLPNFDQFHLVTRYTDGIGALSTGTFLGLILYGLVLISFTLVLGGYIFSRRPL